MENRRTTLLALAAVILTLGALWYIHRPVILQETTLAEVRPRPSGAAIASLAPRPWLNFIVSIPPGYSWWTPARTGSIAAAISRAR